MESGWHGVRTFYKRIFRSLPLQWAIVAIAVPPLVFLLRDGLTVAFRFSHGAFFQHPTRTLTVLLGSDSGGVRRRAGVAWFRPAPPITAQLSYQ
jgi:hypothetical protein